MLIGTNVILVHDNAGFHTTNDIKDYLIKSKIEHVFMILRVPQLNVIESFFAFQKAIYMDLKFQKIQKKHYVNVE